MIFHFNNKSSMLPGFAFGAQSQAPGLNCDFILNPPIVVRSSEIAGLDFGFDITNMGRLRIHSPFQSVELART